MTVRRRDGDERGRGRKGRGGRGRGSAAASGTPPRELRARGASLLLAALATAGAIHGAIMLGVELQRIVHLRGEVARIEGDIAALRGEAAELRAVAAHAGDEIYREQLARRQGFVHRNELRVMLPAAPRSVTPAAPDEAR